MKDKILVFESKNLGYDSSNCFLKSICKELRNQGLEVEYCRIESIEEKEEKLISYIGKSYLAVLDMNSNLSLVVCGDNEYYLNLINAPFYHFLVDHPMHLHEKLKVPLKDYHVICLDEYHAAYIRENYPHIKDVIVMPYGGIISGRIAGKCPEGHEEEFKSDFKRRSLGIMFPATYMPPDYYLDLLREQKPMYIGLARDMLDLLQASAEMTIEEAYKRISISSEELMKKRNGDFAANMYELRLIDRYIRAYLRDKGITQLLRAKREIHVIGANWGLYDGKDRKYLKIHEQVAYDKLPDMMAGTKVLFNTQPLFMDGPHDRAMNAVVNGAAALTDECNYLHRHFSDGVDIVFYNRSRMEKLPEIAEQLFSDEERLGDIAWRGYQKGLSEHTWGIRVEDLIKHLHML